MGWPCSVLNPQRPCSRLGYSRYAENDRAQSFGLSLDCDENPSRLKKRRASSAKRSKSNRALSLKQTCNLARVFVRAPGGGTVPVDVDLTWAVEKAMALIIGKCGLQDICTSQDNELYILRFRSKVLSLQQSLRECGAELGSVLCLEHADFGNEGPLPGGAGLHRADGNAGRISPSNGPRLGPKLDCSTTISL